MKKQCRFRTFFLCTFIISIGILIFFTGCVGEKNKRTPVARKTDTAKDDIKVLRILTGAGHAPKSFINKFEEKIKTKYGRTIKIQISHIKGPESFYDLVRAETIDVVMMTHHYYRDERFKYIKNKLLVPLNLENIPNFKHVIPALQQAKHLNEGGKVYASPVSQGIYGLAHNTTLLINAPKSWNILWDARFKGKYVLGINEYIYNANITALALGYPRKDISNYDALNNKKFKEKLRKLATNAHSFWESVDTADALTGKVLATSWGDSMGPLKERGEPWMIAEPTEGSVAWNDNYSITRSLINKPFLKKVAEEYINELLTPDYQVGHIMHKMSLLPIITNIKKLLTAEEKKKIHLGLPNFFENNRILQHIYSHRNRNGIKKLWEQAIKGIDTKK